MAKINTLTDKLGEFDFKALQIDIQNIKEAINALHGGLTTTQTFKDASGVNKTMTITNGRITAIS